MTRATAITTFEELADLHDAWAALEHRLGQVCVFQSGSWLAAQAARLSEARLAVGLVFDGEDLVVALPGVVGGPRNRLVAFLGRGDRNDVLCAPGYEALVGRAVEQALLVAGPGSAFLADDVPVTSPLLGLADEGDDWRTRSWEREPERFIGLEKGFEAYLAEGLNTERRKSLLGLVGQLERAGELILRPKPSDIDTGEFLRWGGRHKFANLRGVYNTSLLCRAVGRRMLEDFARHGGALLTWSLELDGRRIAGTANLRHGRTEWHYLPFLDPDFLPWSPGAVLLYLVAASAAEAGMTELNLGGGGEGFGREWATGSRALTTMLLAPRHHSSVAFTLAAGGQSIRQRIRRSAGTHAVTGALQGLTLRRERLAVGAVRRPRGGLAALRSAVAHQGLPRVASQAWQAARERTWWRQRRLFYALALEGLAHANGQLPDDTGLLPVGQYEELRDVFPWRDPAEFLGRARKGYRCFVVRREARIVSVVWALFGADSTVAYVLAPPPGTTYLFGTYTAPAYRGQGLAGAVYRAVAVAAAAEGQRFLLACMDSGNGPSIRSVEKAGWKLVVETDVEWRLGKMRATAYEVHDAAFAKGAVDH